MDENRQIAKEIVRRVEVFDEQLGRSVPKQLTIRTSSKHAFITGYDVQVLIGLFALHFQKDKFASPKFEFNNQELYRLMKWPEGSGANNERLQIALDRFAGVQLTFENSFSADGGDTVQKTYSTGVLDSYQFTKTRDADEEGASWIRWSGELFVGFRQGNIKPLDTEAFFSLKRPVSQQAYRLLDDAFRRSADFAMDLAEFATRVGVSNTRTGVIKQRLKPIIEELEQLPTFIQTATESERYSKRSAGNWKIHFRRADSRSEPAAIRSKTSENPTSTSQDRAETLVREFYQLWRGERVHRVLPKERRLAQHLLDQYQPDEIAGAMPMVIKELKLWKEARTFNASARLWHQPVVRYRKRQAKPAMEKTPTPEVMETTSTESVHRKAWRLLPMEKKLPIIRQARSTTTVEFVRAQIDKKKYDDPLVESACVAIWKGAA